MDRDSVGADVQVAAARQACMQAGAHAAWEVRERRIEIKIVDVQQRGHRHSMPQAA